MEGVKSECVSPYFCGSCWVFFFFSFRSPNFFFEQKEEQLLERERIQSVGG